MIYPPQYKAEVITVDKQEKNVKVDLFDSELISADKSLKLNIFDSTEIVLENGQKFEGDIANRKLVVIYDKSTRSIPAQTTPVKVIVLNEEEKGIQAKEDSSILADIDSMDIIVNNKKITAPTAYAYDGIIPMVPLREISEALGFEVKWNQATRSIIVGNGIFLTIGNNKYTYMKNTPIELETAPELVYGRTYVPLNFFKKVARINNAYIFERQIVIDEGELLE